jgi:hypothetical protein
VPYLLELLDEPTELSLAAPEPVAPSEPDGRALPQASGRSRYRLRLPMAGLPDATLRLETSARVFTRTVTVVTRDVARDAPTGTDALVDATWRHADPETPAPPLEISLGARLPGEEMFVLVDDGDNQKLPVVRPTILLPTYRLRFFRQAGTALTLLYGRTDIGAPRYDIQLIAPRLLDAAATEIAAVPEGTDAIGTTHLPQVVFWVVLGVVVLALLLLVARLVRASPAPAPGDAAG